MSNHEFSSQMSDNMFLFQEQEQTSERSAVFEHLEGSHEFAQKIMTFSEENPDRIINLSVLGVPGAGKETIGGHFIHYLQDHYKKDLAIRYVSFADMVKDAKKRGWVKNEIGSITPPEFVGISILFRDTVAALNAKKKDPQIPTIHMYEMPAVHETRGKRPPIHLGTYALEYLGREENKDAHFCIGVVRNPDVLATSYRIRELLEDETSTKRDFNRLFKELGVRWEDFDLSRRDEYRKSMGSSGLVKSSDDLLDQEMVDARNKEDSVYPHDFLDVVTLHFLQNDPEFRARAEAAYFQGFIPDRYGVQPDNLLIAENTHLSWKKVNYFRELINSYKIDINPYLERFAQTYMNQS